MADIVEYKTARYQLLEQSPAYTWQSSEHHVLGTATTIKSWVVDGSLYSAKFDSVAYLELQRRYRELRQTHAESPYEESEEREELLDAMTELRFSEAGCSDLTLEVKRRLKTTVMSPGGTQIYIIGLPEGGSLLISSTDSRNLTLWQILYLLSQYYFGFCSRGGRLDGRVFFSDLVFMGYSDRELLPIYNVVLTR